MNTDLTTDATGAFNSTLTRDVPLPVNATTDELDNIPLSQVEGFKEVASPWYADQVLPFDITIAAANEYGAAASCKIYGVEILNEGFGTSVDDSVLEQQATFVARSVLPLFIFITDQSRFVAGPGVLCGPNAIPPRASAAFRPSRFWPASSSCLPPHRKQSAMPRPPSLDAGQGTGTGLC